MREATCAYCGDPFHAARVTAVYCSAACRSKARRRRAATAPTGPVGPVYGTVSEVTEQFLHQHGMWETRLGAQAMIVAGWIDSPASSDSGIVACSRELSRLQVEIRREAQAQPTPTRARDRKRAQWRVLQDGVDGDA